VPGSRMFTYRPLVTAEESCTARLHALLYDWYDSSPLQLIKHLIRIGDLSPEECAELRPLLDQQDGGAHHLSVEKGL